MPKPADEMPTVPVHQRGQYDVSSFLKVKPLALGVKTHFCSTSREVFRVHEETGTQSYVFVSQILELLLALLGLCLTIWNVRFSLLWSPISVSRSSEYQNNIIQWTKTEFCSISVLKFILTGVLTVSAARTCKPCLVSVSFNKTCNIFAWGQLHGFYLKTDLLYHRSNPHKCSAVSIRQQLLCLYAFIFITVG